MPISGISLRGMPIEVIHLLGDRDTSSLSFVSAQAAFSAARGSGTPLLPETPAVAAALPARISDFVITILSRYVAGESPTPRNTDEANLAAELHLALIESVARIAANVDNGQSTAELPLGTENAPVPFAALLRDGPEWVRQTTMASLARKVGAVGNAITDASEFPALSDPIARLAAESAYWRSVPAVGAEERVTGKAWAAVLSAVRSSDELQVEPFPINKAIPQNRPDDWVGTSTIQMAGLAASRRGAPLNAPSPEALRRQVLERFASGANPPARGRGREVWIVEPASIRTVLSNLDVMDDYEYQPVST